MIAGCQSVWIPDAIVIHEERGSQSGDSASRICRRLNGLMVYLKREHGLALACYVRSILRLNAVIRGSALMLLSVLKPRKYWDRAKRQLNVGFVAWGSTVPSRWRNGNCISRIKVGG